MKKDDFSVRVFPVRGKKLYRLELWYDATCVRSSFHYKDERVSISSDYSMRFTKYRMFFWFIAKWMLWHARRQFALQTISENPITEYR